MNIFISIGGFFKRINWYSQLFTPFWCLKYGRIPLSVFSIVIFPGIFALWYPMLMNLIILQLYPHGEAFFRDTFDVIAFRAIPALYVATKAFVAYFGYDIAMKTGAFSDRSEMLKSQREWGKSCILPLVAVLLFSYLFVCFGANFASRFQYIKCYHTLKTQKLPIESIIAGRGILTENNYALNQCKGLSAQECKTVVTKSIRSYCDSHVEGKGWSFENDVLIKQTRNGNRVYKILGNAYIKWNCTIEMPEMMNENPGILYRKCVGWKRILIPWSSK